LRDLDPSGHKGAFHYKDGGHLAASYVREHATFIDEIFQEIEKADAQE
jgi:hypothetical protein